MGQVHDVSNKHVPARDSCHSSKGAEGWLRGQKLEDIKMDHEALSLWDFVSLLQATWSQVPVSKFLEVSSSGWYSPCFPLYNGPGRPCFLLRVAQGTKTSQKLSEHKPNLFPLCPSLFFRADFPLVPKRLQKERRKVNVLGVSRGGGKIK